jgi:Lrp/AsnC family transcriptional regulator, leucine-responsive regulatory protein
MDTIDYQIVEFLTQDARMPFTQIAERIGRSTATVHQRVRRLREQGIIKSFTAELDWEALGYPLDAFVSVRDTESHGLGQLAQNIGAIPFVMSAAAVTGEFDLLLHIRARSSSHLGEILDDVRRISPGPSRTLITLTNYISGQTPPLPAE